MTLPYPAPLRDRSTPGGRCRRTALVPLLLLLALALPALPASATTAVLLDDDELVDRSRLIVAGACLNTETARLDRRLVTLARFRVDQVLKGGALLPETELTVVLPGGADPDAPFPVAEVWPGAPTLLAGEEAVLFLRPFQDVDDGWTVVGFSQGKFGVRGDDGGARVVRDLSGTSLQAADGTTRPGGAREEALADLLRRVRERVEQGGGGR